MNFECVCIVSRIHKDLYVFLIVSSWPCTWIWSTIAQFLLVSNIGLMVVVMSLAHVTQLDLSVLFMVSHPLCLSFSGVLLWTLRTVSNSSHRRKCWMVMKNRYVQCIIINSVACACCSAAYLQTLGVIFRHFSSLMPQPTISAKSSQLCGDKVSLSDRPWMSSYIMQCVSWLWTVFFSWRVEVVVS
jgi:hypothetical protein